MPHRQKSTVESAARTAALIYVTDDQAGIRRRRAGTGFSFQSAAGVTITDPETLTRIRKLAIPPAWRDIWICPTADGHIQATGRDEKGRKQYLYHPVFRAMRDEVKYSHMLEFAAVLPTIRSTVEKHMRLSGLPREKVLATTVQLLESTLIRVGNDDYAKENGSYGLTTLHARHVQIEGADLRFRFRGKSGKIWRIKLRDRRVAKIVRSCQELPGQQLLQYQDARGTVHDVTSSDVNAYLRDITGKDITAKNFRTWAGTVLAATALQDCEPADSEAAAKKNITTIVKRVAAQLGNTVAICRKCYIHPSVLDAYKRGSLERRSEKAVDTLWGLKPEEAFLVALLKRTEVGRQPPSAPDLKAGAAKQVRQAI